MHPISHSPCIYAAYLDAFKPTTINPLLLQQHPLSSSHPLKSQSFWLPFFWSLSPITTLVLIRFSKNVILWNRKSLFYQSSIKHILRCLIFVACITEQRLSLVKFSLGSTHYFTNIPLYIYDSKVVSRLRCHFTSVSINTISRFYITAIT